MPTRNKSLLLCFTKIYSKQSSQHHGSFAMGRKCRDAEKIIRLQRQQSCRIYPRYRRRKSQHHTQPGTVKNIVTHFCNVIHRRWVLRSGKTGIFVNSSSILIMPRDRKFGATIQHRQPDRCNAASSIIMKFCSLKTKPESFTSAIAADRRLSCSHFKGRSCRQKTQQMSKPAYTLHETSVILTTLRFGESIKNRSTGGQQSAISVLAAPD